MREAELPLAVVKSTISLDEYGSAVLTKLLVLMSMH